MQISEELVRKVVMNVLSERAAVPADAPKPSAAVPKQVDPSGILRAKISEIPLKPFENRQDVRLCDIATLEEAPRIGCGVMELSNRAGFEWTLAYDEWDVVLEGRLEIQIDGRVVAGEPGDVLYIPRDSHIHFTTPEYARFVYTVFPADW